MNFLESIIEIESFFDSAEDAELRRELRLSSISNAFKDLISQGHVTIPTNHERYEVAVINRMAYDTFTSGLHVEVDKFHVQRALDIKNILADYASSQIKYHCDILNTWAKIVPHSSDFLSRNMQSSLYLGLQAIKQQSKDETIYNTNDPSSATASIRIQVSNVTSGLLSGLKFQIITTSKRPGYEWGEMGVYRTSSDVTWLLQRLTFHCPACVIPQLTFPTNIFSHRSAWGSSLTIAGSGSPALTPAAMFGEQRVSEAKIEIKRRTLEAFLYRIVRHGKLSEQACVRDFLTADADQWTQIKKEAKTVSAFLYETSDVKSRDTKTASHNSISHHRNSTTTTEVEGSSFLELEESWLEDQKANDNIPHASRLSQTENSVTHLINVDGLRETVADVQYLECNQIVLKLMDPMAKLLRIADSFPCSATETYAVISELAHQLQTLGRAERLILPYMLHEV
jgi:hypothetical protein